MHPRLLFHKYHPSRYEPTVSALSTESMDGGKQIVKKWTTFEHQGVLFPPEYTPHNIPIVYNGVPVPLQPAAEEYATLYARYIETDYIKNRTFNKNFWSDWKPLLKSTPIESLDGCDFRAIYEHFLRVKEERKTQKNTAVNDDEKYKTAIVDGKPQPVGNFRIEPPGIFMGRGCNPKLGRVKRRIYPEDIIINIGKEATIPAPLPGHQWADVIHDNTVEWIASWKDNITGKIKYVWLGAHSDLKTRGDMAKFETARKLKKRVGRIRCDNEINMKSDNMKTRQIATALYFIDVFALRVGNEKGEDETDTVGVTSLRVEHIDLLDKGRIKLDFLGKDSVRYNRTVQVDDIVYENMQQFTADKNRYDNIFGSVTSIDINRYLQSFMPDLTAKVFRTYNASNTFQKELKKVEKKFVQADEVDQTNILLDEYNKANAKVALLCNHQKNINKSSAKQINNLNAQIKKVRDQIRNAKKEERKKALRQKLEKYKSKKSLKVELKNISLGTSKINYIDPRISVAFMKKYKLPLDKVFNKTLQEKFKWAMDVDADWKF